MPYSFLTLPFNANSLSFSPYNDSLLAVTSSQNFGLVGNGRVHILQLSPSGISVLNQYILAERRRLTQVRYARRTLWLRMEWSPWESTCDCLGRRFNQAIWHYAQSSSRAMPLMTGISHSIMERTFSGSFFCSLVSHRKILICLCFMGHNA